MVRDSDGNLALGQIRQGRLEREGPVMVLRRSWRKCQTRRKRQQALDWPAVSPLMEQYPVPPVREVHSVYAHAANP